MTDSPGRWRAARLVAIAAVLLFCVLELAVRRSSSITDDWQGWRQADTQAIARNLAFVEPNVLRPRIDWGGDGPGYVEAELPLYPAIVAVAIRAAGESEWPGQVLSLACVAGAALAIWRALERRFGDVPALIALLALLSTKGIVVAATSIQPDTLSFFAFTIGFLTFLDFMDEPTWRRAIPWIVATAVAGLVKPTTLELGVVQGVLVLARGRDLLRSPRLWIGWAIVVGCVGLYLAHAHRLFVEYGNTFGILSGGDSKLPRAARLADPRQWLELLRYMTGWGTGYVAVLLGFDLALRKRLANEEIALGAGAIVLGVLAFRYTSSKFGTHYHLPEAVLGAWLVAHGISDALTTARIASWTARAGRARRAAPGADEGRERPRRLPAILVGLAVLVAAFLYVRTINDLHRLRAEPETEVGHMLAAHAAPGTLVVVRARAERWNDEWRTANNFEDPRVFYITKTHGWVLPNDEPGAERLAGYARRGARFYAHVNQYPPDAALASWLASHAEVVASAPSGTVYRIEPGLHSSP